MPSPTLSATQKAVLDRILSDAVSSKFTPALFFGVTTVDGPIYTHHEGTKLVDDPTSDPIDEDTVYWLCSQTKLITTIAAFQLIEQGKITLDTPAESVLPELANPVVVSGKDDAGNPLTTPATGKITFGQLLNHTSGIDSASASKKAYGISEVYAHSYKDEDVAMFFKILKGSHPGVPLKFEPGTDFAYGFSADCVGFIVERLSGKSLEQYLQDHIFAPLGITSASFYLTPPLKARLLPMSYRTKSGAIESWNGPPLIEQDPAHVRVHFGGLGLYASQKDYLVLLRHILQIKAGSAPAPIISRASVDSIFASTLPPAGIASLNTMMGFPPSPVMTQFGHGLFVMTADHPGMRRSGTGATDLP